MNARLPPVLARALSPMAPAGSEVHAILSEADAAKTCKYGDAFCPCQDGDSCHYEGKNPMRQLLSEADAQATDAAYEFTKTEAGRQLQADRDQALEVRMAALLGDRV